jgi:PPOX class probable F420-dependent enzyme
MTEPVAERPHMPGYGIEAGVDDLLPWSWAEARLAESAELWLATTAPDGRPHLMPVWAVWLDGAVWLSTGHRSRKGRNLLADPRCTVATDDTRRPLVIEGVARPVTDEPALARFTDAVNEKYASDYGLDFFLATHVFRVEPGRAFGLEEDRFTETPTRWTFPP